MLRSVVCIAVLGLSSHANANPLFDSEISQLNDKATLCNMELDKLQKPGGFCEDFSKYTDLIFKSSAAIYIQFHMGNGDITNDNAGKVIEILKKSVGALNRMSGH